MIIAVDLDKTLIKTDLVDEMFFNYIGKDWKNIFICLFNFLFGDRLSLKNFLSINTNLNIADLPYDCDVLKILKKHRKNGDKCILVSGSTQKYVELIANHLKIFDDAYGSCKNINLVGENKKNFLIKKYGANNFIYFGDSYKDLPVFRISLISMDE